MKLKTKLLVCSACLSSLLGLSSCSQPQTVQPGTISADGSSSVGQVNGSVWTDTQGNAIQAHDNIIKYGDTYYWYGMDYSKNLLNGGTGGFKAIKCYASKDLVNWELASYMGFRCDVVEHTDRMELSQNRHRGASDKEFPNSVSICMDDVT